MVDISGMQYSVFLFETIFLCCLEGPGETSKQVEVEATTPQYPIHPWELGVALRERTTPLNMVNAIPTANLRSIRFVDRGESSSFAQITVY